MAVNPTDKRLTPTAPPKPAATPALDAPSGKGLLDGVMNKLKGVENAVHKMDEFVHAHQSEVNLLKDAGKLLGSALPNVHLPTTGLVKSLFGSGDGDVKDLINSTADLRKNAG